MGELYDEAWNDILQDALPTLCSVGSKCCGRGWQIAAASLTAVALQGCSSPGCPAVSIPYGSISSAVPGSSVPVECDFGYAPGALASQLRCVEVGHVCEAEGTACQSSFAFAKIELASKAGHQEEDHPFQLAAVCELLSAAHDCPSQQVENGNVQSANFSDEVAVTCSPGFKPTELVSRVVCSSIGFRLLVAGEPDEDDISRNRSTSSSGPARVNESREETQDKLNRSVEAGNSSASTDGDVEHEARINFTGTESSRRLKAHRSASSSAQLVHALGAHGRSWSDMIGGPSRKLPWSGLCSPGSATRAALAEWDATQDEGELDASSGTFLRTSFLMKAIPLGALAASSFVLVPWIYRTLGRRGRRMAEPARSRSVRSPVE